jgi:hypothetical protein
MRGLANRTTLWCLTRGTITALLPVLALGLLLTTPLPASALTANVCMQTNYTNHGLSQALNCTANDVRVARATNIDVVSGGECHLTNPNDPNSKVCTCNQGGAVTFSADYEVVLTAQTRYDIGIYFATDGDPNGDGALTGACKLATLDATNSDNFVNLDAAPDVCGDINSSHNPQLLHLTLTTTCTPGTDGKLKLPNCTSWRQPGSNEVCDEATDAFPGSPSKCNCSPGFTVDIFVETATIEVTKTASPTTVPETGGSVTYNVSVKNLAQQASVTLDSLTDNIYGDITSVHGDITSTTCVADNSAATCQVGGAIAAGATCTCSFTATVPPGDAGGTITDTVTACGTDSFGHSNLCDDDDATVTYTDVRESPVLTKTATATDCRVDVTYSVVVSNSSAQDTLTLNSLTDDKFGDITTVHAAGSGKEEVVSTSCGQASGAGTLPAVIAKSGNYSCTFKGRINSCSVVHTNTVTGSATDDDGATYDGTSDPPLKDDAAVTISVTIP